MLYGQIFKVTIKSTVSTSGVRPRNRGVAGEMKVQISVSIPLRVR